MKMQQKDKDTCLRSLYEELYGSLQKTGTEAHFVAMCGPEYRQSCFRFMLIGRSTNGWKSLNTESPEMFGADAQSQFDDSGRWDSLIESSENGVLKARDNKAYCPSIIPFWSYAGGVFENLCKLADYKPSCSHWMKNIAWSNLYKIAPGEEGNPNEELMASQLPVCRKILQYELEVLQPTHVLILAGYDYFKPFASVFEQCRDKGERNIMSGQHKNEVFVEGTACFGNAKVVIACRPEYRQKDAFVEQVVREFQS